MQQQQNRACSSIAELQTEMNLGQVLTYKYSFVLALAKVLIQKSML